MTRILIVQGHPDADNLHLCHALAEAYGDAAKQNGHSVEVIDVAKHDIPFLRSKEEWESDDDLLQFVRTGQEAVLRADHFVIIYPLWMGDMPAILKAWFEQVMRQGFAFEMNERGWRSNLKGKSARVIVTVGMPALIYRWFFFAHSLRSLDRNILKFCGIRPVKWSVIGGVEDPSGKTQKSAISQMKSLGAKAL